MNALFLSPHNDDETLFGAFTLLRYRPKVVIVLRSSKQEAQGVTAAEREAETVAAMDVLGCEEWEQWLSPDSDPDWHAVERALRADAHQWDRVFAPAVEDGGHEQHNWIGAMADSIFSDRVTHYMTYTLPGNERSRGVPVEYENEWVGLKLCALSRYESQIRLQSTGHHFAQALHEWYEA